MLPLSWFSPFPKVSQAFSSSKDLLQRSVIQNFPHNWISKEVWSLLNFLFCLMIVIWTLEILLWLTYILQMVMEISAANMAKSMEALEKVNTPSAMWSTSQFCMYIFFLWMEYEIIMWKKYMNTKCCNRVMTRDQFRCPSTAEGVKRM